MVTIRTAWGSMSTLGKVLLIVGLVLLLIFVTGMIHFPGGTYVSPPVS
jgi:hypothetical protein